MLGPTTSTMVNLIASIPPGRPVRDEIMRPYLVHAQRFFDLDSPARLLMFSQTPRTRMSPFFLGEPAANRFHQLSVVRSFFSSGHNATFDPIFSEFCKDGGVPELRGKAYSFYTVSAPTLAELSLVFACGEIRMPGGDEVAMRSLAVLVKMAPQILVLARFVDDPQGIRISSGDLEAARYETPPNRYVAIPKAAQLPDSRLVVAFRPDHNWDNRDVRFFVIQPGGDFREVTPEDPIEIRSGESVGDFLIPFEGKYLYLRESGEHELRASGEQRIPLASVTINDQWLRGQGFAEFLDRQVDII